MNFPNIRRLGLDVYEAGVQMGMVGSVLKNYGDAFIRASDLEALLAKAVRVWGSPNAVKDTPLAEMWERCDTHNPRDYSHTALLIAIEPIERESAEDLLREIGAQLVVDNAGWKERIRRVLEGK